MKTIRAGIVGTGGMANSHAIKLKEIAGVRLTACLDIDQPRATEFARKHAVPLVATSLEQLLENVDAVCVVTPDRFHAQPSLAVLKAGKHLLCEKPLTVTLVEARQVAAAARAASSRGVIHMVNFSYRQAAALQEAARLVASGAIGDPRRIDSYYLQSWLGSTVWGQWEGEALLWRLQTAAGSGGVLGDLGCHILDLTTAIAGDVRRMRCTLAAYPKITAEGAAVTEFKGKSLDANDTAIMEVEFAGGALGLVQTTRWATGHVNHLRFEAAGTLGAIRFDLDAGYEKIETCIGEDRHKAKWTTVELPKAPSIWERFIAAIQTAKPDQPDVLRGAQIQAYLDAAERSAASNKWEQIAAWE